MLLLLLEECIHDRPLHEIVRIVLASWLKDTLRLLEFLNEEHYACKTEVYICKTEVCSEPDTDDMKYINKIWTFVERFTLKRNTLRIYLFNCIDG